MSSAVSGTNICTAIYASSAEVLYVPPNAKLTETEHATELQQSCNRANICTTIYVSSAEVLYVPPNAKFFATPAAKEMSARHAAAGPAFLLFFFFGTASF